ncbi:MAG TPA: hypothetical protein PKN50_02040 [Spirochaetota bacterium]|jgi:hypothetical protein|nr:hypothetical protein [Spirochaetota bacterium]HPV40185.1 hypothetical protein [Spirochaetota bacterium]
MKKCSVILVALLFALSCAKYHVKNEISHGSNLKKLKKTGIIIRKTHNTPISLKLFNKNLSQWLVPYQKVKELVLIENTSKNLNRSKMESDRFLQFSDTGDFQSYQCQGIVAHYLAQNKEELDKIRSENNLDSIAIYEVDAGYSLELQYTDFSSMIIIVDNNNKILYMDRQHDKYETFEIDAKIMREELLDLISNRLINKIIDLKYVKEK